MALHLSIIYTEPLVSDFLTQHPAFNLFLRDFKMVYGPHYLMATKLKSRPANPYDPIQTVTLYSLPHGVSLSQVEVLTTNWGELISADYRRYRTLAHIKNAYFHIKLRDLKAANVPKRITVNGRYVTVMIPGENGILRCGLCKAKGHKVTAQPKQGITYRHTNPNLQIRGTLSPTKIKIMIRSQRPPPTPPPLLSPP